MYRIEAHYFRDSKEKLPKRKALEIKRSPHIITKNEFRTLDMDFILKKKHTCLAIRYSEVPNKRVTYLILFWDFFLPTWPARLFIFWKSFQLYCFLRT